VTNALAPLLDGPLAFIRPKIAYADDPREAVRGVDLAEGDVLRDLLSRFAAAYPGQDRRAVASLWSKWLFAVVLEPVLATSMRADWALPVALGDIGLILTADGRAEALKLDHAGAPFAPVSAEQRFAALIDDHLAPVVGALARTSGITPRVLWSNAGNYFEHAVRSAEQSGSAACPGVIHGKELLASRTRPDGRSNPLFAPIYYLDEPGRTGRRRRICCIRYLIPGQAYCGVCPIVRQEQACRDTNERQEAGARA